jgi:hypothetical protein
MNALQVNILSNEIRDLIHINSHTEARIAISKAFEQEQFLGQFEAMIVEQNRNGFLSVEVCDKRDYLTRELFVIIEDSHGKEVRDKICSEL